MKIYINRYLNEQILEIKKNEKNFKFNVEKAQIIIYQLTNISKDNIDEDGYISVCSVLFRKLTFRDYNKYLDILINFNLLVRKNYSTKLNSCNKYKIIVSESDASLCEEVDIYDYKLTNKMSSNIMPSAKQNYKNLYNWLKHEDFTIDYENAINKIQELNAKPCIKLNFIQSVNAIRYKNIRFICRQATDKRLHTNITNLKSVLRQFLYYKSKKLVNIDLKNSQIYFLAMLLLSIKHKKVNEIRNTNVNIILHELPETLDMIELQRFVDLAVNGVFYQVLGQELIIEKGFNKLYEKRKFDVKRKRMIYEIYDNPKELMKPITFELLFSSNDTNSKEKDWFYEKFPTISNVLMKIKEIDYTSLALLLQNIESDTILNRVTKFISKHYPHVFMLTIHDSIMTLPEHANIVQKVIMDITSELFGYSPKLSVE
ncbi:hypothetical protein [Flavobacterium terrigena]|uniref:DNA-directed RNA polymerase n=1 Tax=Flavobacterium terrigena TaxID=402734 RepID=A0A1H6XC20_9FLAO|nr:hypothetical protein [Flavobacterium terrigena]SEJ26689.1 hypothetical protein SAMN05660918_2804 [Flavobacterium terrigena]